METPVGLSPGSTPDAGKGKWKSDSASASQGKGGKSDSADSWKAKGKGDAAEPGNTRLYVNASTNKVMIRNVKGRENSQCKKWGVNCGSGRPLSDPPRKILDKPSHNNISCRRLKAQGH